MRTAGRQVGMARILVVDDYRDTAESMAIWLKQLGHAVNIARDGVEAIEIARRERPQYVLLDLGLPRLDGYQVASRLRQELPEPLVIIAVTGYGRDQDRRRALEAGCDHHLLKPVDPDVLMSLLSGKDNGSETFVDKESSLPAVTGADACGDAGGRDHQYAGPSSQSRRQIRESRPGI